MSSEKSSKPAIISGALLIISPLFILFLCGIKINTNILDLLPGSGHSEEVDLSVKKFSQKLSSNHIFLLKSDNWEEAVSAAVEFQSSLEKSGLFESIKGRQENSSFSQWHEFYFPHRFHLLTEDSKNLIKSKGVDKFLEDRVKKLYSPQSSLYSANLEEDPLMLFPDYLQQLPLPTKMDLKDGWLFKEKNGCFYIFFNASFKDSVFSAEVQKEFRSLLNSFQNAKADTELLQLGFFPYAERARTQAEWEISFIGTGSLIGILLLFIFIFRSLSQLIITVATIGTGILWGLAVTQLIFGQVHIITIVFGATLTGVCVDYAFHWLCGCFETGSKEHIRKGVFWGGLTSLLAYGSLCLTGFPGLTQIAIFSCAGIIVCVYSVLKVYPQVLDLKEKKPPQIANIYSQLPVGFFRGALLLLVIVSTFGLSKISTKDDIRDLQNRPADLVKNEQEVRAIIDAYNQSRFILIQANDNEDILEIENRVKNSLSEHCNHLAISDFIPTQKERKENFSLIKKIINSNEFEKYCNDLGFEESIISKTRENLKRSSEKTLNSKDLMLKIPEVSNLVITEPEITSIILLNGIVNEEAIAQAVDTVPVANYINQVRDTSEVMKTYRIKAAQYTFLSYLAIFLILTLFLSKTKAMLIISSPVLASVCCLGILSLLGVSLNLFNILAFMLILGIGIDYSIFMNLTQKESPATVTAICLSTFSTLLAFGLLAFSQTPALQTFGLTMAIGIILSFAFANLGKIFLAVKKT